MHGGDCTGTALTITGSDITLDLAGRTIRGAGDGPGILVRAAIGDDRLHDVTVRGGAVKGYQQAI